MELVTGVESYLSSGLLPIYYFIVALGALVILMKFRFRIVPLFIVIMFIEGLFFYLSYTSDIFKNVYKIGFLALAVAIFGSKLMSINKTRNEKLFLWIFVLIGFAYLISNQINGSNLLTTLSQYLKKYGIPVLFYFGLKYEYKNPFKMKIYASLFTWLLGLQIILLFTKLLLFGFGESLVGSISFLGGAPSNTIPVLGFLLIWLKTNGRLKQKDWIFVLTLFLSMAIIGNKRSVWFIMPVIIGSVYAFVSKYIRKTIFLVYIPLLMILFVIGVKTNPTLNPDGSRWGRFDIEYVFNYSINYTFGNEEERARGDLGQGRGGGFYEFIGNVSANFSTSQYFFGLGVEEIVTQDYDEFDKEKFWIKSKGSAGAFVQNFISTGLFGTILIFLFGILLVRNINNKPLRRILYFFMIWEYVLFYNSTIIINATSILFIFIIIYHNWLQDQRQNQNAFRRDAFLKTTPLKH
ncbi:MAG TPA: hypothetical protein PLW31_03645 [Bacteroidales bacterium]|nr:hypothetical protein [Bacteroidales bacterium]HPM02269.1 hypothetical protein [Candidatus Cloacimonadota bacterium]